MAEKGIPLLALQSETSGKSGHPLGQKKVLGNTRVSGEPALELRRITSKECGRSHSCQVEAAVSGGQPIKLAKRKKQLGSCGKRTGKWVLRTTVVQGLKINNEEGSCGTMLVKA